MNLEINRIYTFKLATGEEIVTKVLEIDSTFFKIDHPISCILSPQGLQMMPGLFSANMDTPMQLNKSSVVLAAEAREDVRNSWIQATTGITTVSKQIITG